MSDAIFTTKKWLNSKGYLHFDTRLSAQRKIEFTRYVKNPLKVAQHSFHPFIFHKVDKHKIKRLPNGKRRYKRGERTICHASHEDSHIYTYYSELLSKRYESALKDHNLQDTVIAFRKIKNSDGTPKCNIHLAKDAFEKIVKVGPCKVLAIDVENFFPSLLSSVLKKQWKEILKVDELPDDHYRVFKSITQFDTISRKALEDRFQIPKSKSSRMKIARLCDRRTFRATLQGTRATVKSSVGIPQGAPISAVLANIYMLSFDIEIASVMRKLNGYYFRYCDDILLIFPSEQDMELMERIAERLLGKIGLYVNPLKTDRATFIRENGRLRCERNKALQYLGLIFDGQLDHISIRPGSISRFIRKLKGHCRYACANAAKANKARKEKDLPIRPVFLKQIYKDKSKYGVRNFFSYVKRAEKITKSPAISSQKKKLDRILKKEICRIRPDKA